MFSGGDSSGEGVNNLNQFGRFRLRSQNSNGAGAGSIDWALLAAQWIQMQDSSSTPLDTGLVVSMLPEAPPPPSISYHHVPKAMKVQQQSRNTHTTATTTATAPAAITIIKKSTYEEKGEADMDMDDDDGNENEADDNGRSSPGSSPPPPAPSMQLPDASTIMQPPHWYLQQQKQMQMTTQVAIPPVNMTDNPTTRPWNAWPPRVTVPPPTTVVAIAPVLPTTATTSNRTTHIPSLMKLNVPNPNTAKSIPEPPAEVGAGVVNATMDAAKRKVLPAWIREGLEKMEREKQKQLERQQQSNASSLDSTVAEQPSTQQPLLTSELMVKHNSKKALESDSSGNEDALSDDNNVSIRKTLATAAKDSVAGNDDTDIDADGAEEHHVGKSYEQKLGDLMIVVRRTLTELLLEVTNDEISNVTQEAVKSCKRKASSAQVIRKSALSSITGKLGLAAYANSSSDDESSSENEKSTNDDNEVDSEEELKVIIRQRRRTFAKAAEEIEERVAVCAQREEQKLKYYTQIEQQCQQEADNKRAPERTIGDADATNSNSTGRYASTSDASVAAFGKGYEREFGETTTETKLQHSNGKRLKVERLTRKERITRFSDNKDSKAASMAYITQLQQQQQQQKQLQQQQAANLLQLPAAIFPIVNATAAADAANNLYASYSGHGKGIINVLSAAEAALDKATKRNKTSSSSSTHKGRRRHKGRHYSSDRNDDDNKSSSSSSSPTSSSATIDDSNSSVSTSSRRSKHKRSRNKQSKRSDSRCRSSGHQQKHARSSSSSRKRSERDHYVGEHRQRHDERHHRRQRQSSESDDYHQSSRTRSRSRSRSSYASSSSRRRRH